MRVSEKINGQKVTAWRQADLRALVIKTGIFAIKAIKDGDTVYPGPQGPEGPKGHPYAGGGIGG